MIEAIQPYLTTEFLNPSSMYDASKPAAKAIASARRTVADLLEFKQTTHNIMVSAVIHFEPFQ